ncbi:MAG: glucosamine 6-phosphate synthetase [Lysinibacillus sp.]|nr:glucosamine 6-phosphate synthetase [Lysinibacillus sp.]
MGKLSKRNILWVVPFLIIIVYWFMYGPSNDEKNKQYITYIKESTLTNESTTNFESAFNEHCNNGEWIYFKTSSRQNVVEYIGACPVDGQELSNINLQFIVEKDQASFTVGAMLVDGEKQSTEERDAFLNKILSPNNEIATP